jgi:hypothetical protein
VEDDLNIIGNRNWIQKWQDWDKCRMVIEETRVHDGLFCQ